MVTHAATLDVPRHVVELLARLLAAHRRRIGTPKGSRALGPFRQAVLVLRWFRDRGRLPCLARDAGVCQATGYRYLHEGVDVLAESAPDLHEALRRCHDQGTSHLVLDGVLVGTDRVARVTADGNDLRYSGKHTKVGGNVQFLATPLWICDVEPGMVHDIVAARRHVLPALYEAAAQGLPTRADAGYQGAGTGTLTPIKKRPGTSYEALHVDNRTDHQLLPGVRARGERTAAEPAQRWRALKHITPSPHRIGRIAKAALVLNPTWK